MGVFTAPKVQPFGFRPDELEDKKKDKLCQYLAETKIICEKAELLKAYLKRHPMDVRMRIIGFQKVSKITRTGFLGEVEDMARWCWNLRPCLTTTGERLSTPITKAQEYHLAYKMDLLGAFV